MQGEQGYSNPVIMPGDRLVSIDEWNLEDESIETVKAALRGVVHTPALLKLCRRVPRKTFGGANDSEDLIDFNYEVKLLRMHPNAAAQESMSATFYGPETNFFGLQALGRAVNRSFGDDDEIGTPRPAWTSPVAKPRNIESLPKACQPFASPSMPEWLLHDRSDRKGKPMILKDLPGNSASRPSSIPTPQERRTSRSATPSASSVSTDVGYSRGDVPLSRMIADMVDPDSPRACETADPWVLVA